MPCLDNDIVKISKRWFPVLFRSMAQRSAQMAYIHEVGGSSPSAPTHSFFGGEILKEGCSSMG